MYWGSKYVKEQLRTTDTEQTKSVHAFITFTLVLLAQLKEIGSADVKH